MQIYLFICSAEFGSGWVEFVFEQTSPTERITTAVWLKRLGRWLLKIWDIGVQTQAGGVCLVLKYSLRHIKY